MSPTAASSVFENPVTDWRHGGDDHRQSDQGPHCQRARRATLENDLLHGGLVVFVRARDPEREELAMAIMRDCGLRNVHVHEVRMKRFEDAPL